jgi:hypothetical protein
MDQQKFLEGMSQAARTVSLTLLPNRARHGCQ